MIERDALEEPTDVLDGDAAPLEREFEAGLRPQRLDDFIGQTALKENLHVLIDAAKKRGEPLEHVLFYGHPGLGKTTLANVLAHEMGAQVKVTSGPALEHTGDLVAVLSNLSKGDVLFIDEIHRLNHAIEEVLYPAMEDFAIDIITGKGPTARTLHYRLETFTIIGATTRLSLLSSPLRDRFGAIYHLDFYAEGDVARILERSARLLGVPADADALALLSTRARRTPRIANRLLRRLRDYAQVRADGRVTRATAEAALGMLDVDAFGLDQADRRLLSAIVETFHGGPVGLSTLAAATQEELATIEEVHEPFLLQLGMIQRTPRGRVATERAYRHLGLTPPVA